MIKAILFDVGDTLISEESVGDKHIPTAQIEKVPLVDELLRDLEGKYKLGIVTNTTTSREADIRAALREMGIEKYFGAVVTSVDVGREKPDEKIFVVALRRLGVKPSETVMVGNRIKTDIVGANKLGITTVWFKWNNRYPEEITSSLEKPGYKISSLMELLRILQKLKMKKPPV